MFKSSLLLIFIWILGTFLFFTGCISSKVEETVVGSGWANNSVNTVIFRQNAVTTYQDYQFTAYYDEKSNLTLGKRKLKSNQWEIYKTQYKGNTKAVSYTHLRAHETDSYLVC